MVEQDATNRDNEQELLNRLVSQDWRERKEAVDELAQLDRLSLARAALEIIRQDHANLSALNASLQLLERVGQPLTTEVIALLNGSDQDLRIYVPIILAGLGGPEAVQALMQAAADPNQPENVRFNAVEALGQLRAAEAAPVLVELLRTENSFMRFGLVVALGRIGLAESTPVLLPLLEDPYLNEAAVQALGNTGDAHTARAIGAWMLRQPGCTSLAAAAVANIERRQAQRSAESGFATRQAFLDAVGLEGVRALCALSAQERDEFTPEDIFWADLAAILGWASSRWPAEEGIRTALVHLLAEPEARLTAETVLQSNLTAAPGAALQALLLALTGDDLEQSYAAARLLRTCADPQNLPTLADVLKSPDEMLATLAVEAVGAAGGPQAVELLFPLLDDERDTVRQAAVEALTRMEVPGLEERAQRLLGQPQAFLRASALRLLASMRSADIGRLVAAAAEDPSVEVRQTALELLPRTGAEQTVGLLAKALHDPDANLRRAAVQACAELPAAAALPLLESAVHDDHHWVRVQAVRGFARLASQQSLDVLAASLRDPFPPVRSAVVEVLAKWLAEENLPSTEQARIAALLTAAQEDGEELVRQAARAALKAGQE